MLIVLTAFFSEDMAHSSMLSVSPLPNCGTKQNAHDIGLENLLPDGMKPQPRVAMNRRRHSALNLCTTIPFPQNNPHGDKDFALTRMKPV